MVYGTATFTSCAFTSNSASRNGGALFGHHATVTFAPTLPSSSFSGNTGSTNYGNCYNDRNYGTITGSCS